MNASDNLISLSDSGAEQSFTAGLVSTIEEPNNKDFLESNFGGDNVGGNSNGDAGTGLLIDFSDEVQIPLSQGILLQAEIDDTFGIFSKALSQGSGVTGAKSSADTSDHGEEDAARLIRSFISGRKSDDTKARCDHKDVNCNDDSVESNESDQLTVVEMDAKGKSNLSPTKDGLNEISSEKLDETSISNTSGGSGSEIFDVLNLSSFSIPDGELDDNKFIEDVKSKDMVATSAAIAVVHQIKLDILQEEVGGTGSDTVNVDGTKVKNTRAEANERYGISSEISRTSAALSTLNTGKSSNRVSFSNHVSNGPSDGPMNSSVLCGANSSTNAAGNSNTRSRLSSSNFGSPIRASYPMSNAFYMPTPKAKTPSGTRNNYHERLSDSFCSPGRTGLMLITGNSYRSPLRVPVRKSISAETLHYENGSPVRDTLRHPVKFSTPSVSKKSRHSFSKPSDLTEYPNWFGDDIPLARTTREFSNNAGAERTMPYWNGSDFKQYRVGRLSCASSSSNNSLHSLSPTKSSVYSNTNDITVLTCKLNRMDINSSDKELASTLQPIKATAIVPPNMSTNSDIKSLPTSSKTGLLMHGTSNPAEQRSSYRPIAQSSPTIPQGSNRPISQTTPTRSKFSNNTRSSGYGPQQNLNSMFGANKFKSPSKLTPANIKPPAIPKSLKSGVPSLISKLDSRTAVGEAITTRTTRSSIKPGTGLRRPMTSGSSLSSATTVKDGNNISYKENNKMLSDTTAAKTRGTGISRQIHRP